MIAGALLMLSACGGAMKGAGSSANDQLMSAAQALDFRRPANSSAVVESVVAAFRQQVSFNIRDRVLHDDMMKALEFLKTTPEAFV